MAFSQIFKIIDKYLLSTKERLVSISYCLLYLLVLPFIENDFGTSSAQAFDILGQHGLKFC